MEEYLTKCLNKHMHLTYHWTDRYLTNKFKGLYEFYVAKYNGTKWLVAYELKKVPLRALKKHYEMIKKISGMECSFYFDIQTLYIRRKLLENEIPFCVWDKVVYLPFLDILKYVRADREKTVCRISFLTQKMLLLALYENWQDMSVPQIAGKLGVTTVAVHRSLDELQCLGVPIVKEINRTRYIHIDLPTLKMWMEIEPVMRNPVIKTYELAEDIKADVRSGVSALCEYVKMDKPDYPTYAITKKELGKYRIKEREPALDEDDIKCVVHEIGYYIDLDGRGLVDPLTLSMILFDEAKRDDRIKEKLECMLKALNDNWNGI